MRYTKQEVTEMMDDPLSAVELDNDFIDFIENYKTSFKPRELILILTVRLALLSMQCTEGNKTKVTETMYSAIEVGFNVYRDYMEKQDNHAN